jgi:hypothetical protein
MLCIILHMIHTWAANFSCFSEELLHTQGTWRAGEAAAIVLRKQSRSILQEVYCGGTTWPWHLQWHVYIGVPPTSSERTIIPFSPARTPSPSLFCPLPSARHSFCTQLALRLTLIPPQYGEALEDSKMIKDLVMLYWKRMQQRKAENFKASCDRTPQVEASTPKLHGWDFMEIAESRNSQRTQLNCAESWRGLVRGYPVRSKNLSESI